MNYIWIYIYIYIYYIYISIYIASCPHGENFQIGNYDLGNKLNSLDSVLRHVVDTNALLSRKLETLTTKINRIADNPNSNRRTGQLLW